MLVSYANANYYTPAGTSANLFHGFYSVCYLSPKRAIMYMEITFL